MSRVDGLWEEERHMPSFGAPGRARGWGRSSKAAEGTVLEPGASSAMGRSQDQWHGHQGPSHQIPPALFTQLPPPPIFPQLPAPRDAAMPSKGPCPCHKNHEGSLLWAFVVIPKAQNTLSSFPTDLLQPLCKCASLCRLFPWARSLLWFFILFYFYAYS